MRHIHLRLDKNVFSTSSDILHNHIDSDFGGQSCCLSQDLKKSEELRWIVTFSRLFQLLIIDALAAGEEVHAWHSVMTDSSFVSENL